MAEMEKFFVIAFIILFFRNNVAYLNGKSHPGIVSHIQDRSSTANNMKIKCWIGVNDDIILANGCNHCSLTVQRGQEYRCCITDFLAQQRESLTVADLGHKVATGEISLSQLNAGPPSCLFASEGVVDYFGGNSTTNKCGTMKAGQGIGKIKICMCNDQDFCNVKFKNLRVNKEKLAHCNFSQSA